MASIINIKSRVLRRTILIATFLPGFILILTYGILMGAKDAILDDLSATKHVWKK